MEFVAVFDELLLLVLARVDRGPEIANFRSLECRAKRAECCINIIGFFPYRTIVDSPNKLDSISPGEWCACRVSWFMEYKHTEPGKEIF